MVLEFELEEKTKNKMIWSAHPSINTSTSLPLYLMRPTYKVVLHAEPLGAILLQEPL